MLRSRGRAKVRAWYEVGIIRVTRYVTLSNFCTKQYSLAFDGICLWYIIILDNLEVIWKFTETLKIWQQMLKNILVESKGL